MVKIKIKNINSKQHIRFPYNYYTNKTVRALALYMYLYSYICISFIQI